MAYDIGPVIGIEGEAQFRQAIGQINTTMKTLATEMNVATSAFDKNDKSMEAMTAQNNVLNKQIDTQKQKVEELRKGLAASADKYGENDKVTQGWRQAVNQATADLNKMERELGDNTTALNSFGNEAEQASAKTSKFDGALSKIGGGLGKVGGAVGKVAIAGIAAVGAAAVGAAVGMFKMATASADYADGVQKSADVTGLSAERVQELTYAGKNLGVEFDTIAGAQAKLTKSMDAAKGGTGKQAEAFKALGISVTDANGNLRSSQDVMNEAFTKLNSVGNETERDALAMQLFGKSAMELNPLIKAGGDELNRLTQEARDNGAVLSGEQVAALDSFGDSIENLKMSGQGLAANITTMVLPAFNGMIGSVQNITKEIGKAVKTGDWSGVGIAVSEGLNSIVGQISGMLPNFAKVATTVIGGLVGAIATAIPQVLPPLMEATIQLLDTMIQVLIDNGPMLIDAGINALMTLIQGIISALPKLIDAAITLVMSLVDSILENLPALIEAAIQIIVALAMGLVDNLPKLIEKVPQILDALVRAVIQNLPALLVASIQIIMALVSGIIQSIPKLIAVVPKLFSSLIKAFRSIDWGQLGLNIINGIISGVKNAAVNLANSVIDAAQGALGGVKNFLGIKSPSTVMRDQVGKMIGLGMAEGITDSTRQVNAAMSGLNRQFTTDLTVNASGSASAGKAAPVKQSTTSDVVHSGTIRVEGVNDQKQLIGAVEVIIENSLPRILRREARMV